MVKVIDYATPGPFTVLDDVSLQALDPVATEPVAICLLVHSLVIQPTDAQLLNLPTLRSPRLRALNKVETLPWHEWGQMTDAYQGTTGEAYDGLLDHLAGRLPRSA